MDENSETYYHCMLCAQLECISKLIPLEADEELFHKTILKLSRLNILYDYDQTFPKNVCKSCNDNVDKAFEFVSKVEKAQNVLSDLYENKNNSLKEQDSDVSGDEQGDILKSEDDGIFKDQQTDLLEDEMKSELFGDQKIHYLEQDDISEHRQNDILEQQSDISEHLDTLRENSESGAGKNFEIYSQSSNDSSVISEKNSGCESIYYKNNENSSRNTDIGLTWNDYQWTCSVCETQFSTHEELKLHSMQYHKTCNALKCLKCNKNKWHFNTFISHTKWHNPNLKFMCYICSCKFSCSRALNSHTRMVHGPKLKYVCPGCNADFASSEELQLHKETFYRGIRFRTLPVELVSNHNSLSCDICKKSFKKKDTLYNHLYIHTDRKKEHICDICGKCFAYNNQLQTHLISHKDQRSHECDICKSSFKTLRHLKNHVAIHSGEKPYKCDQCGKGFRLKKYLNSHFIIHTNSLPYDCMYCDKKFRFKTIRDQHIRQHTGFKPYSCEICARDFTNWPNYNKHMKRRHDLNMAKKKRTPEGVFPINPSTGKIIKYNTNATLEPKTSNARGRPKKT
ncbi:PREDICTED: zinc finger protein 62 homolog [Papilio xuthus]|uniref:Zinc finger protein 62 homolog n=1 Tax=Papilio xuthus TaxID=66420 RepID=A0AAJ7EG62_PAPXU|nr:PREDICTED: zinc finger protein 62 homolog [Papilio xuthus]